MLYQLSYASPEAAVSFRKPRSHPENPFRRPETRMDTLSLRTYDGTDFKVSIAVAGEQTVEASLPA